MAQPARPRDQSRETPVAAVQTRGGKQGRIANHLTRFDVVILDELGYLPFAQSDCPLALCLITTPMNAP